MTLSTTRTVPWTASKDGNDLIMRNVRVTAFGLNDPQDNGVTACGLELQRFPWFAGISLPMDGRSFKTTSKRFHDVMDGSPLPRVPWGTMAVIESCEGVAVPRFTLPVIEEGPALYTGNGADLTVAAAKLYKPAATATNFEMLRCVIRILNAGNLLKA